MFSTTTDKTLICSDCGQEFAFTASEQQFYADRQFSEPRRCPSCRASRKAARGDAGSGGGYSAAATRAAATTAVPARCSARRARAAAARRRSRSDRTAPSRSTAATASRSSAATRPRLIDRPKPGGPRRASSNSRPWRSVMRPRRISRPTLARRQDLCIPDASAETRRALCEGSHQSLPLSRGALRFDLRGDRQEGPLRLIRAQEVLRRQVLDPLPISRRCDGDRRRHRSKRDEGASSAS